ncbi:hypothetical protein [Halobacillus litoralis]|uniref:hypothetical protein n=1 Tax=Halobacillus litoralis TaxID=45668 RepID=UPI001CFF34B1|nr:hypothetical protein [Halobacillus litoralis]
MKKLVHSEWRLSVMALAAFIGGMIGSTLVYRELNLMAVYGYLTGSLCLVAANVIYVLYKKKKNKGSENEKEESG